ncbi:MAG: DUF222 domain-containing protein [Proteobacteria bacterium]|nr:DUF222 domain-containing protein [Pseudomonadota bacterium]
MPCETVRRLCCDSGVVVVTQDKKGNPLNVSRKHRVVQPPLKRALLARDKTCRFPGCTHEKWLDAQSLPRFMGATWCIGQMGEKQAWITPFCSVQNTTDCYMRVAFE